MSLTPQQAVWRWIAVGLWTLQGLAGITLCLRWCSAAWTNPATLPVLIPWTALMLAMGAAAWWSTRQATPRLVFSQEAGSWSILRNFLKVWSPELTTGVVVLLSVLPVMAAGTPLAIGVMLGLLAVTVLMGGLLSQGSRLLEVVLSLGQWFESASSPHQAQDAPPPPSSTENPQPRPTAPLSTLSEANASEVLVEEDISIDEQERTQTESTALQSMHRQSDDQHEWIEGTVQIQFQPEEREIWVHIPFHPPLAAVPEVDAEDLDGNGWDLKVSGRYPYGLRLGVKRSLGGASSGQVAYYASIPLKKCA